MTIITGEKGIKLYHMRAQLGALRLEINSGMGHSSGRSVAKYVKEQYGLKGPRSKLVEQFEQRIKEFEQDAIDHREGTI